MCTIEDVEFIKRYNDAVREYEERYKTKTMLKQSGKKHEIPRDFDQKLMARLPEYREVKKYE